MKISVIIPYYNPDNDPALEKLLIRAAQSAIDNLTGISEHEIIIVNDGSPSDPNLDALSGFSIKYLRRPHGMLGAARNTGMDNSTGDVITFLDADDCYYPNTLEPCLKAMTETGADVLAFGMVRTQNLETAVSHPSGKPVFSSPVSGNSYMLNHNLPGSACRYIARLSLIRNNSLRFVENAFIEDEEFTPRLMHFSQRYVETAFPVYAYCIRKGSIITTETPETIQAKSADTLKALTSLIQFREQHASEPHDGIDRKISYLAMDYLRRILRCKDWRKMIEPGKDSLRRIGLYPLHGHYSVKYRLFSIFSRSRAGLSLLHLAEKRYK